MRLSVKTRQWGAQRRASCARTLANPGSKLNRATTGEAGPTRGPGSAAEPRREQPASRAQKASHANRARLRREEEPREAELGNDGDLAQGGSEHDRPERLLRRRVLLQKRQDLRPEPTASFHHEGRKLRVRVLLTFAPLHILKSNILVKKVFGSLNMILFAFFLRFFSELRRFSHQL